ncbi:unnamed protein product, partial [Polarella glacialis]
FMPDPGQNSELPKAPGPKAAPAPGGPSNIYLSFSSAETLTPESSAGGRPSRASAVGTMSPESRLALSGAGQVSIQSSMDELSELAICELGASVDALRRSRLRPGDFRRRKYAALGTSSLQDLRLLTPGAGSSRPPSVQQKTPDAAWQAPQSNGIGGGSSSSTAAGIAGKTGIAGLDRRSVSNSDLEGELEVLVEGPLQQRHLAFFWRWRWCVLDRHQLKLYRDEEASLLMPEKPLEVHSAASLSVGSDLHLPSSLICTSPTGEPLMFLRTGRGERWEEIAAASLWLRAFASANVRSGAMSRRRSSAPPTLPAALGDGTGPQAEGEASSGGIKSEALAGSRKVEAPPRQ